jgi:hypothetical protein
MEWAEPPLLPSLTLPEAPILPNAVLEVPRAQLPSYKPLVAPPNTLRPPPGIKGINTEDEPPQEEAKPQATTPPVPPEAQIVEVPFTDLKVPMPSTIIMTTAITTALISVAATLLATSLFKYIVMVSKPIIKQAWTKLTKKKNQKAS